MCAAEEMRVDVVEGAPAELKPDELREHTLTVSSAVSLALVYLGRRGRSSAYMVNCWKS